MCAFLDDDSLKCWGYNYNGQTGIPSPHRGDNEGEMGDNLVFVNLDIEVQGLPEIALGLGKNHTCTLDGEGTLKCWGTDASGELGRPSIANRACVSRSGVGAKHSCIKTPTTVDLGDGNSATAIALGENYGCAILDDGPLKCWGSNLRGRLGLGDSLSRNSPTDVNLGSGKRAIDISTGGQHMCAILDDGALKCWGENADGQLGNGGNTLQRNPVAVTLADNKDVVVVSAGNSHTCAVFNDGTLACWGANYEAQLGDGSTSVRNVPTQVTFADNKTALTVGAGKRHTCAILNDNSLVCWGRNEEGQLGVGSSSNQVCTSSNIACIKTPAAVDLGTDRTAKSIAMGEYHTCAILDDNSVKCWGQNAYGQVGDGSTTQRDTPVAVSLPAGRTAVSIHAGWENTCAILDDNSVFCWGENLYGQLNDGTTIDRYSPVRMRL